MILNIEEREKIRKPNTFEFIGNKAIKSKNLAKDIKFCLCLNQPVMTVITVNINFNKGKYFEDFVYENLKFELIDFKISNNVFYYFKIILFKILYFYF